MRVFRGNYSSVEMFLGKFHDNAGENGDFYTRSVVSIAISAFERLVRSIG